LQIHKLSKGASKAIANSLIQRATNVDLIKAKLRKKKKARQTKGKNYGFAYVLDEETIKERESYYLFKDY